MPSLLSIGSSGLTAAYTGLQTASHNISNVNTPGFSRQQTIQSTPTPLFTGAGFIGRGVDVVTVKRLYSDFLSGQANQANALAGEMGTRAAQLRSVEGILGTADGGVPAAMNSFYSALAAAAANPGDLTTRQVALFSAGALAARFNEAASRLEDQRHGAEQQVRSTLANINEAAHEIAALNDKIAFGQATGQTPNDLLDRRDALIRNLNRDIGITIVKQDDGALNLFVGNGQTLVIGNRASDIVAAADPYDAQRLIIGFRNGAAITQLRSTDVSGGNIAGLLKFMDQDLPQAQDGLGRIATALAYAFNAQHRLGTDRDGNPGSDLFQTGSPTVMASRFNTGTATLTATISDATALEASAYRVDYSGGNYIVTRLSDNNAQSFATMPQTVDGVTLSVSAAPAAGDSFLVQPVRQGAGGIALALTRPQQLALALPVAAATAQANRGTVSMASLAVNGPTVNANLTQAVTITFTAPGLFDVTGTGTGNPVGVAYTPGTPITYNGWTLALNGIPAAGDIVSVGANTGLTGDNRNGLALVGLRSAALVGGGALTEGMAGLIAQTGTNTAGMQSASSVQDQILGQAVQDEQSVSGVNLDEEATRLMQYQQAYQASAKVLATAQTLFDTLLSIAGR